MRVLHTADWHLKDRLGHVSLHDDLLRSLTHIASVLEERAVDVMVVAGDLFRERLTRDELRDAVGDMARVFGPFLQRGGSIVAVAGNHDHRAQIETLRSALRLAPGADGRGRIHLFANADVVALTGRDGDRVQFVCLPFPDEAFLRGEWEGAGEMNRSRQETCRKVIAALQRRLDPALPSVFVSHIHVTGVPVGGRDDHRLGAEDAVQLAPSDLPLDWAAYVALGHIHRAQSAVPGSDRVRYCGSIVRMDLGERDDQKGVFLLDVLPGGTTSAPEWVPLPDIRPIRQVEIDGEAGLSGLEPDPESLVKAVVRYVPGVDNVGKIRRTLRGLYPRLYADDFERVSAPGAAPERARDLTQVRENVLEFLNTKSDEKNRAALRTLVEEILN